MTITTSKVDVVSDNSARRRVDESHTAHVVYIGDVRTAVDRLARVLYVNHVRTDVCRCELQSVSTALLAHTRRYGLAIRIYTTRSQLVGCVLVLKDHPR